MERALTHSLKVTAHEMRDMNYSVINLLLISITVDITKKMYTLKRKVWRQRDKENRLVNMNYTLSSMDNSCVE